LVELISKKMYGASSVALKQHEYATNIHDFAMIAFAYGRAATLWNKGEHSKALGLTMWENAVKPSMPYAAHLREWMSQQEDIFDTWRRENANVYFAQVDDDNTLIDDIANS